MKEYHRNQGGSIHISLDGLLLGINTVATKSTARRQLREAAGTHRDHKVGRREQVNQQLATRQSAAVPPAKVGAAAQKAQKHQRGLMEAAAVNKSTVQTQDFMAGYEAGMAALAPQAKQKTADTSAELQVKLAERDSKLTHRESERDSKVSKQAAELAERDSKLSKKVAEGKIHQAALDAMTNETATLNANISALQEQLAHRSTQSSVNKGCDAKPEPTSCTARSMSFEEAKQRCDVDISKWDASVVAIGGSPQMALLCIMEGNITMQKDMFANGFVAQIPKDYKNCWPTAAHEFAVAVQENKQSGTGILRIEPHGVVRVEHLHAAGTAFNLPESFEDRGEDVINVRLEGVTFVPNGVNPFPKTCVAQCFPPKQDIPPGTAPPVGCVKRCELTVARMDALGQLQGKQCACRLNKRLTCFPNACDQSQSECQQFKELANTAELDHLCRKTCQKHLVGF
jgi:hypothetical protein